MSEDPTLNEQIARFTSAMAERAPREVIATLGLELEKLAASGIAQRALQVGARAPDLALPEARGTTVELSALLARGPVVVTRLEPAAILAALRGISA